LVAPMHLKLGKRDSAVVAGLVGMAFWVTPLTLRHFGLWWPDGTNAAIGVMFVFTFFSNLFSVIATMSIWSMVADVVEASEVETGRRSEGTFSAGAFFASKCSTGLGIFVTGYLLAYAGMPAGAKPGEVAPQIVDDLAIAYVMCVFILAIGVALIVRKFPITRAQHEARLALLADAAKADPEGTALHP